MKNNMHVRYSYLYIGVYLSYQPIGMSLRCRAPPYGRSSYPGTAVQQRHACMHAHFRPERFHRAVLARSCRCYQSWRASMSKAATLIVSCLCFIRAASAQAPPPPPDPCTVAECTPVFYPGLNGSKCFRIPSIISTHKGTLLAADPLQRRVLKRAQMTMGKTKKLAHRQTDRRRFTVGQS